MLLDSIFGPPYSHRNLLIVSATIKIQTDEKKKKNAD